MKTYYVDTARTTLNGKRRQKPHMVFDGERIFKVKKLTDLKDAEEIFIDTLFPENYEEALELLKNNVKIYLLRDLSIIKKLRLENNVKKNDENDALMLSKIPKDNYRLLTIDEIELKAQTRPLIARYERFVKWRRVIKQWLGYSDILLVSEIFNQCIKLLDRLKEKTSREIIDVVKNSNSMYSCIYREVANFLDVNDSVILAILILETPLYLDIYKLKALYGYTPNKNNGRYNHRLRTLISSLAANIYITAKRKGIKNEKFKEFIEKMDKRKAIYKIEIEILKTIWRTFTRINNKPETEPAG